MERSFVDARAQILADATLQLNIWMSANVLQAERIMSAAQHELEIHPIPDVQAIMSRQVDSQLLAISLFQVRALSALILRHCESAHHASLNAAIKDFDNAYPQVRQLRNVVAHIDEYIEGRGRSHRNKTEPSYQSGSVLKLTKGAPTEYTITVTLAPGMAPLELPVLAVAGSSEALGKAARRATVTRHGDNAAGL